MVVIVDLAVLPDPAIGQGSDQPVAVLQLQHMRGTGAVGPGVGPIIGVVQMKVGVEGDERWCALVLQIELGQLRMLFGG